MNKFLIITWLLVLAICFLFPSNIRCSFLLTREDCADLYSMVRERQSDNALDILRRITSRGLDSDSIVRLYDYCLRSEEGIRYRRLSPPLSITMDNNNIGQSDNDLLLLNHKNPLQLKQQQQQRQQQLEEQQQQQQPGQHRNRFGN